MESLLLERNMKSVFRRKTLGTLGTNVPRKATLSTIVLCSEDPRVDPAELFDLVPGEVHVLRTVGPIVTNDVMRSILAILAVERVDAIVVLGNIDPLLADPRLLGEGYTRLARLMPESSPYARLLATREKAKSYWSVFGDPVQNVFVQVSNLAFLKTLHPGMILTGMLCLVSNGHVLGMDELRELKKTLDRNPKMRIDAIVPKRYAAFEAGQKAKSPALAPVPDSFPAGPPATDVRTGEFDLEPLDLDPLAHLPALAGSGLDETFSATREQVALFMDVVRKTMSRGVAVKVFVPKVRVPKVNLPRSLRGAVQGNAGRAGDS